jgi:hypothetical protein
MVELGLRSWWTVQMPMLLIMELSCVYKWRYLSIDSECISHDDTNHYGMPSVSQVLSRHFRNMHIAAWGQLHEESRSIIPTLKMRQERVLMVR